VYTTDPRLLPEARRVARISYDEMLELASLGAGVMHNRSIEFAKKYGVAIHVRSSLSDADGTMIVTDPESDQQAVCGAAVTKNEARVTVIGVPDIPGTSWEIFSRIAERNVTVDMIVQNVGAGGKANISFTVPLEELDETKSALRQAVDEVGADSFTCDDQVSKVSAVGLGMAAQTGVADRMFAALSEAGVNIHMITTSEIKISVLVHRDQAQAALRAVHHVFALHEQPAGVESIRSLERGENAVRGDVAAIVADLQGADMEELVINDVSLDGDQARVTIAGVPDQPGVAAQVFQQVAAAGVFVDMIVQSFDGVDGLATLSFTVPRSNLDEATAAAEGLRQQFDGLHITRGAHVAKLSVSGIGLRSHTGVAIRMFRTLSDAGVNVAMINTSEVRVNVVVAGAEGDRALGCLQAAFDAQ
ncbi:MAG: aspartate kinase, partial [Pirellulaceae bacterium]|nr:aspartate kinase [Pirellulaceae bacterium]